MQIKEEPMDRLGGAMKSIMLLSNIRGSKSMPLDLEKCRSKLSLSLSFPR